MQQISIHAFGFNKETQVLSEEASTLSNRLNMDSLLRYEAFEVVGNRETRRYCLFDIEREPAQNEWGDILVWKFRQVDRFGRALGGPQIHIFND